MSLRTTALLVSQTNEIARTVQIRETADRLSADGVRVAEEERSTVALLLVVLHRADGILTTAVLQTGVDALAVDAGFVQFTVAILQTALSVLACTPATAVWITAEWTGAFVAARLVGASGAHSTQIWVQFTFVNVLAASVQCQCVASWAGANARGRVDAVQIGDASQDDALLVCRTRLSGRAVERLSCKEKKFC